ncbi:MAG: dihydropteroate synthase [Planctomycetales bacterium]|nr:dihydropteroate synthase [Planctomycetales bacterium]
MKTPPPISKLRLPDQHFHLVTGKLAARGLHDYVAKLAKELGFRYSIDVLPISVAALLTPKWIAPRLAIPPEATALLLPGHCDTDLSAIHEVTKLPVYVGPRDFQLIEAMLTGKDASSRDGYGDYSIEIIAEINHAPRMSLESILETTKRYAADGADVIDIGCDPGERWSKVGECVRAVRDLGLRVSIDSFEPQETAEAVGAGAELVLSVNSSNRDAACDWGCEVVAIPDESKSLAGFDETIETLDKANVPYRIDPILEPIGFGFTESVVRFHDVRKRYPDTAIMMGIGNLSELTDADSAGVNVLLLGICAELRIGSVLTTEVINWARSSVRECDLARRLMHYAVSRGTIPKHIEPNLVMLRDPKLLPKTQSELDALHSELKDPNYRVFAELGKLHIMNGEHYFQEDDPFELFDRLLATEPQNMSAGHAFYLGYEMAKAVTALTLGKQYRQDEALDWGMLTVDEKSHRAKRAP